MDVHAPHAPAAQVFTPAVPHAVVHCACSPSVQLSPDSQAPHPPDTQVLVPAAPSPVVHAIVAPSVQAAVVPPSSQAIIVRPATSVSCHAYRQEPDPAFL